MSRLDAPHPAVVAAAQLRLAAADCIACVARLRRVGRGLFAAFLLCRGVITTRMLHTGPRVMQQQTGLHAHLHCIIHSVRSCLLDMWQGRVRRC